MSGLAGSGVGEMTGRDAVRRRAAAIAVMVGLLGLGLSTAPIPARAAFPGATLLTPFLGVPGNVADPDLNGDGRPDIVVPDFGTDLVSVRLNRGGGRFGPLRRYAVGLKPSFIASGDFNRDGHTDLAVSNAGSLDVSVLINRGDGTFAPAHEYPVSAPGGLSGGSFSIEAVDVNHDGLLDLVTSNSLSNDVSVLLGRGDGTFAPARTSPIGGPDSIGLIPFALSAADLTGDGSPDLITGGLDSVTVMRNSGAGAFTATASYPVGLDVACTKVGDFNGDGHPDIVATGTGTLNAQILLGRGNGTFSRGQDLFAGGFGAQCASIADFNGDGHEDIAVVNSASPLVTGDVAIFFGRGDGTFTGGLTQDAIQVGFAPWATAVGDFNGDGIPDLIVANSSPPSVSLLLGNGDGTFANRGFITM
jgi:hypothetical protein